jgi:hypothetical protein
MGYGSFSARKFLSVTIFAPSAPADSNRGIPFAREARWLAWLSSGVPLPADAKGSFEPQQASQRHPQ